MNCKPGDLAVIVRSVMGNEGRIVRCLELDLAHGFIGPNGIYDAPAWRTDVVLNGWIGDRHSWVPDAHLRPIRDPGDEATDETLLWLPSPHKEAA